MTSAKSILAIECTHQCISVAVSRPEGVVERTVREWRRTAETIVPLIERVLAEAKIGREDVRALAVSSGPGSFTALRIGMATAKGIAYGLECPLVTVPTVEALAHSAVGHTEAACLVPVVPARKGEFYYAVYRRDAEGLRQDAPVSYATVGRLKEALGSCGERCALVARETAPLEEVCVARGVDAVRADFFTAASLISLAEKRLETGGIPPLESVTPEYQQKFRPEG